MKSPILQHSPPARVIQQDGWELAAHFGAIGPECAAAIHEAAIREASHLSRLDFSGPDHLDFLHRMTTNDFIGLEVGHGHVAVFPDNRGRIIEAGTFTRMSEDTTRFIGGTKAGGTLPEWLDRYRFAEQLEWVDRTADTCMFELIGPRALSLFDQVLGIRAEELPPYGCSVIDQDLSVARVDLGHCPRLQIFVRNEASIKLWDNLLGCNPNIIGELAFEALRVQFGVPLPGSELNDDHNPWEAGLAHAVNLNKGCYIGQEVIARLDTYDKVKQRLVGLALTDDSLPSTGTVISSEDRPVGVVTSAVHSPALDCNIALGYVRSACAEAGTMLQLSCDDDSGTPNATVVELPFVTET
jgi:hypothetical protein